MLEFSLKEQRFILRPLSQADAGKYLIFFNGLGEESIRCRFGHLLSELTELAARQRTAGNTKDERAVAIFDGAQEQIIAIGRCYLDGKTKETEIALVVAESARNLGLGRFLLRQLVRIAREEGSESVSAFIATKNAPVIRLLQSGSFVVEPTGGGDDLKLVRQLSSAARTAHPSSLAK